MKSKTWIKLLTESNRLARRYRPGRDKQRQRNDDLKAVALCVLRKKMA